MIYMKKIILLSIISAMVFSVMPAMANHKTGHKNNNASSTDNASSTHAKKEEIDLVCMQNAIVKRDNAVIASINVYVGVVIKSIEARRDALKAAWTITDKEKRKEALRMAWENDKNTRKGAKKAFKKSRNGAWEVFRTDRKVCRGRDDENGDGDGKGSGQDEL